MSYWNFRMVKTKDDVIGIHETYYNENNEIIGYTEKPISIVGETYEDIVSYYKMIEEAFHLPVLYEKDLKQ